MALIVAGVLFVGIAVLPVGLMFVESLRTPQGVSLANYSSLLTGSRQRVLLTNSFLLALSSSTLAILLGAPLGFFLAKTKLGLRPWWRLLLMTPLLIPPYILGISWMFSTDMLRLLGWGNWAGLLATWTFSLPGAVVILSLCYYPIPMLVTEAALNRVGVRLEEAAWLVAGWKRTLWSVTLPLVHPSVAAGFLLVFILSLAEFSVPALLRVRVFATEIYTQFAAFYDFGAATAAASPLLVVILIIAFLIRWLLGERIVSSRRSLNSSPLMTPSSWLPFGKLLSVAVLMVGILLPIASLAMKVDRPMTLWRSTDNSTAEIGSSLALSATAAVLAVGLGLFLGYWRARTNVRWKRVADAVWISLFALPGTVLGIGLVRLWNEPGLMSFYGTWGIVIIGLVARFTPMAALLLAENVRQLSVSWEEAALVHGAEWWQTFGGIVIPNLKKGLWAVGFLIFVLAFGEVAITILLIPPGRSTLPLKIFATIANSPDSVLASLCLFQTTVILFPLFVASGMIFRPRRPSAKEVRGLCL